jgi:hypothetical protein
MFSRRSAFAAETTFSLADDDLQTSRPGLAAVARGRARAAVDSPADGNCQEWRCLSRSGEPSAQVEPRQRRGRGRQLLARSSAREAPGRRCWQALTPCPAQAARVRVLRPLGRRPVRRQPRAALWSAARHRHALAILRQLRVAPRWAVRRCRRRCSEGLHQVVPCRAGVRLRWQPSWLARLAAPSWVAQSVPEVSPPA